MGTPLDQRSVSDLAATLPVMNRLALSYAPRPTRQPTLALLALDARLAAIVRGQKEPMLAQLRLAWWRDVLGQPVSAWPDGEPLLAALRSWRDAHAPLAALVDGWEGMVGDAPLGAAAFEALAQGRGCGFAALAEVVGSGSHGGEAGRLGGNVALADLAVRVSHPAERECLALLARDRDWRAAALPRALRPLAVLHGLAARSLRRGFAPEPGGVSDLFRAMRLGLLGR
ncbi:MAG: squalene/phytoene synthase family protein [Novosphingobium sp.]|nr:squalene/phytoene synthase family protein [Novosphingobium sp.]